MRPVPLYDSAQGQPRPLSGEGFLAKKPKSPLPPMVNRKSLERSREQSTPPHVTVTRFACLIIKQNDIVIVIVGLTGPNGRPGYTGISGATGQAGGTGEIGNTGIVHFFPLTMTRHNHFSLHGPILHSFLAATESRQLGGGDTTSGGFD